MKGTKLTAFANRLREGIPKGVGPTFLDGDSFIAEVAAAIKKFDLLVILNKTCFAAGTPVRTANGWKPIEAIQQGERVWSRPEDDPSAANRLRVVDALFQFQGTSIRLTIGGQLIETTAEHPFFVVGTGWTAAADLEVGMSLATEAGGMVLVESIDREERDAIVYNLRVEEDHTYFVGKPEWGFAVWVHNTYSANPKQLPSGKYGLQQFGKPVENSLEFDSPQLAQEYADNLNAGRLKFDSPGEAAPKGTVPKEILRQFYTDEVAGLERVGKDLLASGKSEAEVAEILHEMRRGLGVKYKDMTPADLLEYIHKFNEARYEGDKLGPTLDLLRKQGKTNAQIIAGASRPLGDMKQLGAALHKHFGDEILPILRKYGMID